MEQKNKKNKSVLIGILIIVILIFPFIDAQTPEFLNKKINLEIDSPLVIREGNSTNLIIRLMNLDEQKDSELTIKEVNIFNENKELIISSKYSKKIKTMKEEIDYLQQESNNLEKGKTIKDKSKFNDAVKNIKEKGFKQTFKINLYNFKSILIPGDIINISIIIKIVYDEEEYFLNKNHEILISEPLPSPPHNSPGWYAGDQHVHSEYSSNMLDIINHFGFLDSIPEMVQAAKNRNYNWVIFTEHSFADDSDSKEEWEEGEAECDQEDTITFKCHYGQELSFDTQGLGDTEHYLYYDSSHSFIEADCLAGSGYTVCDLDAADGIYYVNNNGGLGFIAHPYGEIVPSLGAEWEDWNLSGFSGLEIINSEFNEDSLLSINNPGGDIDSWREFLEEETDPSDGFMVGISSSDAHQTDEFNSFSYCYINSENFSESEIIESIEGGHCIATTGPFISFTLEENIIGDVATNVLSGTNPLNIQASTTGEFGELGLLYIYVDDTLEKIIPLSGLYYFDTVDIDLDTDDKYIRMEIYTDKENSRGYTHRAYTNPIWIDVVECTCNSWMPGSCSTGDCLDSERTYTRTCMPSGCAEESKCEYDESCFAGEEITVCNSGCDYDSIEAAVDNSGPYDKIIVTDSRSYDEDIRMDSTTSGWLQCTAGAKISGNGDAGVRFTNVDGPVLFGCTVEGFTYCVRSNSSYGLFQNNTFVDCETGVYLKDEVHDNKIKKNNISDCDDYGVWLDAPEWGEHSINAQIDENIINGNGQKGIYFEFGVSNKIRENEISWHNGGGNYGIHLIAEDQTSQAVIENNIINNNYKGIYFYRSNHNSFNENIFCGSNLDVDIIDSGSGTSGDENSCEKPGSWNDLGTTGCTYYCDVPASATLIFPFNNYVNDDEDLNLVCGANDDFGLSNISLYSNISGIWQLEETKSVSGNSNMTAFEINNLANGTDFIWSCFAYDNNSRGNFADANWTVSVRFVLSDFTNVNNSLFSVKNSSGRVVAWFTGDGNLSLEGNCSVSVNCIAPENSFIIKNSSYETVAYISGEGNLCLEKGNCSDLSSTCNPLIPAFIVKNNNINVSYIDFEGGLCLTGSLNEGV